VAREVGISMPTAQKYKRHHQDRIPSEGAGRRQRYPQEALAVFRSLRQEGAARSGRPRRAGAAGKPPRRTDGPLSLAEVARRTGISYPTLLRYLRLHGRAIPKLGRGRGRRFPEAALEVFSRLRAASKRGPRAKRGAKAAKAAGARKASGIDRTLARRIQRLEAMQTALARQLDEAVRLLKQPLQVTIRPDRER
jgi:DNA-binding transcriptional MerR regulator